VQKNINAAMVNNEYIKMPAEEGESKLNIGDKYDPVVGYTGLYSENL
jgi:hypothetical protein